MKERSRIWILMARKLSGEATPDEIVELERLQQQHPEMTYSLQMLTDLWKSHPPSKETGAEKDEPEKAFSRHLTRMTLREVTSPSAHLPTQTPRLRLAQTRDLIANYLTTTVRSLRRNKGFTAINISGLAIGLASAIVLLLWIRNELSFDQFHVNRDRIYLAMTRAPLDGQLEVDARTPQVMAPILRRDYAKQIE